MKSKISFLSACMLCLCALIVTGCVKATETVSVKSTGVLEEIDDTSVSFDVTAGIRIISAKVNPAEYQENDGLTRYKIYCYDPDGKLVRSAFFKEFPVESTGEFYFEELKDNTEYTVKLEKQVGSATGENTCQIIKSKKVTTKASGSSFDITAELDHEAMTVTIKWDAVNTLDEEMYVYKNENLLKDSKTDSYLSYVKQCTDIISQHNTTLKYYVRTYGKVGSELLYSQKVTVTVPAFALPELKTEILDNCVQVSWKPFVKSFCSSPVKLYRNSVSNENLLLDLFVSDDVAKSDCTYLDCEAKAGDKYILVADDGVTEAVKSESKALTETFQGLQVYRKPSVTITPDTDKVTVTWTKDTAAEGYLITVVAAGGKTNEIEISGNTNNSHVFKDEEFIDLEKGFQFYIQSVKGKKKGSVGDVFYAAKN